MTAMSCSLSESSPPVRAAEISSAEMPEEYKRAMVSYTAPAAAAAESLPNSRSLSRQRSVIPRMTMAEPRLESSFSCCPPSCERKRARVYTAAEKVPPTAAHTARSATRVSLSSQKTTVRLPASSLRATYFLSSSSASPSAGAITEMFMTVL